MRWLAATQWLLASAGLWGFGALGFWQHRCALPEAPRPQGPKTPDVESYWSYEASQKDVLICSENRRGTGRPKASDASRKLLSVPPPGWRPAYDSSGSAPEYFVKRSRLRPAAVIESEPRLSRDANACGAL